MKKTLLNILLAGSLTFGVDNQSKAQEFFDSEFINNDGDDFSEEVFGILEKENNKRIIYYSDKDNDNFHEEIKTLSIRSFPKTKSGYGPSLFVIHELYISKSSGLLDFSVKKYGLPRQYQKALSKMSHEEVIKGYKEIVKRGNLPVQTNFEHSYKGLSDQEIYKTFGTEFGDKIKRRINGSQSKTKLMEVLKEGFFVD